MRTLLLILMLLGSTVTAEQQTSQIECLARNIYFESRGEPIDGQYAVAFVTLNRVEDPRWPDTICDVVYQENQFSWTDDNLTISEERAWRVALVVARSATEQYYRFGEDITDGAVYFNRGPRQPYHDEHTITIGRHKFYS